MALVIVKKTSLIISLIFLFLGIFLPLNSFSQERGSRIALTPLTFEFVTERGESVSERIRVLNPSYEKDVRVIMNVEDMFPEGEEGRVILQATDEDLDVLAISRWVTFEPEEIVLGPREEKSVRFTIDVPRDADPGGHYMGIIAGTPPTELEGTGVDIIHRIASLVLLTVSGDMEEDLSVESFKTAKSYFEHGPVLFQVRFKNEGSVHLMPEAQIVISNLLGREVATVPIEKRNVLPGAVRRIDAEWQEGWLWGGVYTATLEGSYGTLSEGNLGSHSVTFFAFPWKAGVVIFLVLLFFILTRKRWATVFKILIKGEAALAEKKE